MADLSDLETALVERLIGIIYPRGLDQTSIAGTTCRIYRGWPSPAALNNDLGTGVSNITVAPGASPDDVLPHYFDEPHATPSVPGLSATVAGQVTTIAGTAGPGDTVGLLIDNTSVIYQPTPGEPAGTTAANISAKISEFRPVTYLGNTLVIPGAVRIIARVIARPSIVRALRRQRSEVQISCWGPSPVLRDIVGAAIDVGLAQIRRMALADGSPVHMVFLTNHIYDQSQNASLYRRDLRYRCEYSVLISETTPAMIFGELLTGGTRYTG